MGDLERKAPPSLVERQPYLQRLRALKMARSAHAYVRGSTEHFYEWMASPNGTQLPRGPAVWICGDCHVGNLGAVGRLAGTAVIEIRDLDQTVIGNPAYDLVRLGLSLAMASRSSSLPGVTTARMTENLVAGYEAAFEGAVPSEEVEQSWSWWGCTSARISSIAGATRWRKTAYPRHDAGTGASAIACAPRSGAESAGHRRIAGCC